MLDRIKWKLINFSSGRNGMDSLNKALFVISFILYLVAAFTRNRIVSTASMIVMLTVLFRCFSKNIYARRAENDKFIGLVQLYRLKIQLRREYKVFKCLGCGRNIRVPRHRGKIEVTCPTCGKKKLTYTGRRK